jgi:hypothetical protein
MLSAILKAAGYEILRPLPKDKQLDWEAIFANNVHEFLPVGLSMIQAGDSTVALDSMLIKDKIKTIRDMIKIIND